MNSNAFLKDLANTPENKNMDISDLSLISFGEEKNKLNNKQMLSGSFISTSQINDKFLQNFCFEKENQFTFDINNMTYKQISYNSKKILFLKN
jgi:c-di-GMP-binding flagellar brake protein YcgR